VKIGDEDLTIQPESKRAVDIELLLLNLLLYAIVAAFSFDLIAWPIFLLLFYPIAMRVFIGNHDRYHAKRGERLPRFLEAISEGWAVVVTPWDEPYPSIRKKHLRHHGTHAPGMSSKYDPETDPHSVFELGGIVRVLFSCLFYEEVQLVLDIRNKNLTRSRLYRFLFYVPLLIAYIAIFGWVKFAIVLLGIRIVGFTAWFVFSWVIHQPFVYTFGFSDKMPAWFKVVFTVLHGRRVAQGCLHHATHHAWPTVPYNQLHDFDSAVVRNPKSAPDMRPIGT
jgi:fatty acid desaturase